MQRKPLKHRDYEVDLESRLGKTQVSICVLSYFHYLIWFSVSFILYDKESVVHCTKCCIMALPVSCFCV